VLQTREPPERYAPIRRIFRTVEDQGERGIAEEGKGSGRAAAGLGSGAAGAAEGREEVIAGGGGEGFLGREVAEDVDRGAVAGDVVAAGGAAGEVVVEALAFGGGQRLVQVRGDEFDQFATTEPLHVRDRLASTMR
jgi:hypothetical protein